MAVGVGAEIAEAKDGQVRAVDLVERNLDGRSDLGDRSEVLDLDAFARGKVFLLFRGGRPFKGRRIAEVDKVRRAVLLERHDPLADMIVLYARACRHGRNS